MNFSSRLVVGLVSIVSVLAATITPPILPDRLQGIAKAQNGSAGWSNLFDQAQRLESEDKYSEAEMLYRQILSQPRPDTMNDYMYGSGYRSSNSIRQDAISLFRQLVSRYPNNPTVRAEFLDILGLWGQPEELISFYREIIRQEPTNSSLSWQFARELAQNHQAKEAIAVYDLLLTQGMGEPIIYIEFGDLLVQNQQTDRALQVYLKMSG